MTEDSIRLLKQEVACMKGGSSLATAEIYGESLDRCMRKNRTDWYADIDFLLQELEKEISTGEYWKFHGRILFEAALKWQDDPHAIAELDNTIEAYRSAITGKTTKATAS